MRQTTPHDVGDWRLEDDLDDFVSWRRELPGYTPERGRSATVWVEDSATGDGFIAWAKVEPDGADSYAIVPNGAEVSRKTAVSRAQRWMRDNQGWPGGSGGLIGL